MLFTNPFVSIIFSRLAARPGEARRFLERSTGSRIDVEGTRWYQRLFSHSGHCDGAIRMMANWQLEPLRDALPRLRSPMLILWGGRDNAIPPSAVTGAAALIPDCEARELPGLGHLAHEEDPALAASLIAQFARNHGLT
jgi:magnesium chelatase accessory protein